MNLLELFLYVEKFVKFTNECNLTLNDHYHLNECTQNINEYVKCYQYYQ